MSVLSNLARQGLLMGIAAFVSLIPVVLLGVVAQALNMVQVKGFYGHGNFILLWGFLAILLYIPLALFDDHRRRSKSAP